MEIGIILFIAMLLLSLLKHKARIPMTMQKTLRPWMLNINRFSRTSQRTMCLPTVRP